MNIIESTKYKRKYKELNRKHMISELSTIEQICLIIESYDNLKLLMSSYYKLKYNIEELKGDMKDFFSIRINNKLRLIIKPIVDYPYNYIEVYDLEFIDLSDHYKEW